MNNVIATQNLGLGRAGGRHRTQGTRVISVEEWARTDLVS